MYLSTDRTAKLEGVQNPTALVAELRNMQRLFNVTPRYAEIRSLRKDDLHSAFSMVKVGERRFVEKYSAALGGEAAALENYRKAKQTHATAMNFYLGQAVASNSAAPAVVSNGSVKQAIAKFAGISSASPDLPTLFGSLDICDCEQCQSVYSPAAYFVDILKFLGDGPKKNNLTPLQVLFGRRPDLEHIELTCENTTTQVPYVDLTREIMEVAVKAREFKIATGRDVSTELTDLNAEKMPQTFPALFVSKGYSLTDKASVRIDEDQTSAWLILDMSWSFTVKHLGAQLGFDVVAWPQTSWTNNELRANPEHVNNAAYAELQKAVYSWSLPLNVPVEETRGYLGHFDVKRTEVMETFFRDPAANATALMDKSIANEYIGVTTEEAKIITGVTTGGPDDNDPTTAEGPWDFWGLKQTGNDIDDPTDGSADPAVGDWDVVLKRVSIFLQQSGLAYREMLEVLGSYFINPAVSSGRKLGIVSTDDNDATTCNLSKLEIQVVDPQVTDDAAKKAILIATWNKIHRFVRLARNFGWTMRDLDKAIVALDPKTATGQLEITVEFLVQLSHIQRLSAQFSLPVVNLLCFWATMDTGRYIDHFIEGEPAVPSLYATLFNNRAATGQSLPEDPLTLTGKLSENKSRIAAALQISIDDLALMLADTNVVSDDTLDLVNLSRLYRHATFARALNYSTRTYLAALKLKLISATPFATTEDTMKFVQETERIAAAGFSVEDLNYLLRHDFSPVFPVAISDTAIAAALESIREEVGKVAAENNFVAVSSGGTPATSDPSGDLTKRKLASLNWDTAIIVQLIAVLNSASPDATDIAMVKRHMRRFSVPHFDIKLNQPLPAEVIFTGALKNKIYYDNATDKLHFIGVMTAAERTALLALSDDGDYPQAIDDLFDAPEENPPATDDEFITNADADTMFAAVSTPAARFVFVLSKLLPYLHKTLSERIVIQLLGEYLKFDSSSARELLTSWVNSTADPTKKAIDIFVDPAFAESNPNVEVTRGAFTDQFNMFVRLFKIAMLNLKFDLSSEQLQWLFDFGPTSGWLNVNKLPFDSVAPNEPLYPRWARLADLCQLSAALPLSDNVLTDVFTAARVTTTPINSLLGKISQGLSWKLENLTALNTGFRFQLADYKDERALRRLNTAFKLMNKLGASADQCLSWTKDDADEGKFADDVKSLVRATLDDAQWLEKAKTLNDPLREKQRAGLVSYLMLRRDARNADELYDDFLVDVEMSPCMMSTRIKQAIGSIQLFIQRALMNLEPQVALTPKEAREWAEWRKQYRVWEANRKILLYPENWIEPELRDGKSVFFEELENELLQSEVTMDTAETALHHYLEKLHEVARLDIVGMYRQQEIGPDDVLELDVMHIIGRTFSAPHAYFYRRQIDSASWTAWEKVEADIQGDHLIPVIWNRRLYLFWPIFTVKQQQKELKMPAPGAPMEKGEKVLEIQLAWTEYKNGKWSAKKLASPFRSTLKHPDDDLTEADFKLFSFKSRVQTTPAGDEQMFIDFYGPIEKLNTVTITANQPRLKQRTYLFSLAAGKTKNVIASVNNKPFQAGDASLVEIIATDSNNQDVNPPLALSNTGTREIKNTTTGPLKYYLASADYAPQGITNTGQKQVCWIVDRNQSPLLVGGNGNSPKSASIVVDTIAPAALSGVDAITPMAGSLVRPGETQVCEIVSEAECTFDLVTIPRTTNTTTFTTTSVDPTQAIASFYFDDGQQSVMALFDSNAISMIEPVVGTRFENMMMAEFQNQSSDGLTETNILQKTPGTFRLLPMHQSYQAKKLEYPAFFQDEVRSYYVTHDDDLGKVKFSTFYHPTIPVFFKSLNHSGVSGLLSLANQRLIDSPVVFDDYSPDTTQVDTTAKPREDVDFSYSGAYSVYNWELFFHTPFLIATQLSKNQRFEEAQKWFHYIFDPTATDSPERPSTPGPERFWRVKPLYKQALEGTQTLEDLFDDGDKLEAQIKEWQADPFKPHVIARLRLVTYMKAVVMRYIDNLIAWGDQLFRRDTIESINEATQLYILAAQILGRRPEQIPARAKAKVQTFRSLDDQNDLNGLANASVEIEGFMSPSVVPPADGNGEGIPLMPFFGIPGNDKLLGYWNTVADRLFKIRHCQNIDGIIRSLPTFESPIDPALLVKATGVGVDVASALSDINVALPHYRFKVMQQKADELCGEVKSLGGALLAALEKRDAEEMALLRSTHEMKVLNAVRAIKEKQLQEATTTREGLDRTKELTTIRRDYYRDIAFMNPWEITQISLTGLSLGMQATEVATHALAGALFLVPNTKVAAPTSLGFTLRRRERWPIDQRV